MAGRDRPAQAEKPYVAAEAHECKRRAEDPTMPPDERLVWAVLALTAEVRAARGRR